MKGKDYLSILFLIAFLFLHPMDVALSYENDSIIYVGNGIDDKLPANQNSGFFSQREVQSIIGEGKRALFVEQDYKKARKFFEVALDVDVANATACYLLGVIELEEGNLEVARERFRQAHELVKTPGTEQSKLNPVPSSFNRGILSPLPKTEAGGRKWEVESGKEKELILPPSGWVSVDGTPMNIGQDGAVKKSDGFYLPALVKFPSQYRVQVYSQDGWNISLTEGTPPTNGQGHSVLGDVQTVRRWRENGSTIYSFPPNSTYRIKVEPPNKSNTPIYMATLVAVAIAGWLVIR